MVLTADSTDVQGIQIVDLKERLNQEIFCRYLSGIPVTVLAEEYFLSSKTIYSIIAKKKI